MVKLNGQRPDDYEPNLIKPLGDRLTQRKEHKRGIVLDDTGGSRHLLAGHRGREKAAISRASLVKRPITLGRTFSWEEPKENPHETVHQKREGSASSSSASD